MKVFILAGGFATRLWPLTENRAKPMLLVNGKPILQHILEAVPAKTEVFLLTNSRFAADFERHLKSLNLPVKIFCEDAHTDGEKLGALGAIAAAIKHFKIDDDLLVLAGDNLLPDLDLSTLNPETVDEARLAIYELDDLLAARSFGVVELGNKTGTAEFAVSNFIEKPSQPTSRFVSTGFMSLGKNLLPKLVDFAQKQPDALGGIVPDLLQKKIPVKAVLVKGDWFDVGSYEAYLAAHKALQPKALLLEKGASMINCQCQGKVYIAAGAQVKNCVLIDTVVYAKTKLTDCHITQSVIDEDCDLAGVDLNRKLVRQRTTLHAD